MLDKSPKINLKLTHWNIEMISGNLEGEPGVSMSVGL